MKRRIDQGWNAFCKLDNIKRDKSVPIRLKRKAFNTCVLPVMTYGCETWSRSNTQLEKLFTTQRKMERITVGITGKDRRSTNWIRKQSDVTDIIRKHTRKPTRMSGTRDEATWQQMDNQSQRMDTSWT